MSFDNLKMLVHVFREVDVLVPVAYFVERMLFRGRTPPPPARAQWAMATIVAAWYAADALFPTTALSGWSDLEVALFRWQVVSHGFVTFAWAGLLTLVDVLYLAVRWRQQKG